MQEEPLPPKYNSRQRVQPYMKHVEMIVSGKVQGVTFRYRVQGIAREFVLKGETENLRDGTVRIVCEGEEDIIEKFIARVRNMQRPVRVDNMRTKYLGHAGGYDKFTIISEDEEEERRAVTMAGVTALEEINSKQDRILEKQDQTIEEIRASADKITYKQDQTLEKQDQTIEEIRASADKITYKQDQTLEKQDQTIEEIRASADKITYKQDQTLEKQDQTIEEIRASADKITYKQDQTLEKQDQTIEEIRASADKITYKQDQTTAGVQNLAYALAATNSRIEKLENEVAEIKKKILI